MNQYPLHTVLVSHPKLGFIFLITMDQGCHGSELSKLATMVISFSQYYHRWNERLPLSSRFRLCSDGQLWIEYNID